MLTICKNETIFGVLFICGAKTEWATFWSTKVKLLINIFHYTHLNVFRIYGDLEIAHFSSAFVQDMQYSEWALGLGDAASERMAYHVQVQLNLNSARHPENEEKFTLFDEKAYARLKATALKFYSLLFTT